MAVYVYKREDGTSFEIEQSVKDAPLKTCPTTGQRVHRVVVGGSYVAFKGTGWTPKFHD